MSETMLPSQMPDMTGMPTFLFVIDGEIADIQVIRPHEQTERRIAVYSSDPKVYVLEGGFPGDEALPQIGSQWPPSNGYNPNIPSPS